jgi:hypothetical protein
MMKRVAWLVYVAALIGCATSSAVPLLSPSPDLIRTSSSGSVSKAYDFLRLMMDEVLRKPFPEIPLRVEYSRTPFG